MCPGVFILQVHVQPLVVDRVLRFYQGEGQILRRCVRFVPTHASNPDDEQVNSHSNSTPWLPTVDK